MAYKQYKLKSGNSIMITWLPTHPKKVTVGKKIILKGDDVLWEIIEEYDITVDKPPHQDWNNNI